jgi:hypothetical protein
VTTNRCFRALRGDNGAENALGADLDDAFSVDDVFGAGDVFRQLEARYSRRRNTGTACKSFFV